jgi:hypothetical protein
MSRWIRNLRNLKPMTERARVDHGSTGGGVHVQMSKLLVAAVICATAATGALLVAVLVEMPPSSSPPGPGGMPPPPPNIQPLAVFSVLTGLFVLAWLAVLVVYSRDQILARIQLAQIRDSLDPVTSKQQTLDLLAAFRSELASDRERELQVLSERITALTNEYGEQRETDGYLHGMRVATTTTTDPTEATVHAIRRPPAPR